MLSGMLQFILHACWVHQFYNQNQYNMYPFNSFTFSLTNHTIMSKTCEHRYEIEERFILWVSYTT